MRKKYGRDLIQAYQQAKAKGYTRSYGCFKRTAQHTLPPTKPSRKRKNKPYQRTAYPLLQQAAHVFSAGRAEAARRVPAQIKQYHHDLPENALAKRGCCGLSGSAIMANGLPVISACQAPAPFSFVSPEPSRPGCICCANLHPSLGWPAFLLFLALSCFRRLTPVQMKFNVRWRLCLQKVAYCSIIKVGKVLIYKAFCQSGQNGE